MTLKINAEDLSKIDKHHEAKDVHLKVESPSKLKKVRKKNKTENLSPNKINYSVKINKKEYSHSKTNGPEFLNIDQEKQNEDPIDSI